MLNIAIIAVPERNEIRRIFAGRTAERYLPARVFTHIFLDFITIRIIIVVFVSTVVNAQRSCCLPFIKPWPAIGERITVGIGVIAAEFIRQINRVAGTAEIRVPDTNHADKAILAAISRADAERSRPLLNDIDFQYNRVRLHARIELHIHIVKETEVVDALHAAARLLHVERLADLQSHLAQDDAILRLGISLNRIAFQLALVDPNRQFPVAGDIKIPDLDENIPVLMVAIADRLNIFVQNFRIEHFARFHGNKLLDFFRRDNRIPRDLDCRQDRILQHMISDQDAFRDDGKGREYIIKQANVINCVAIRLDTRLGEGIAGARLQGRFRQRRRLFAGALDRNVDHRLTFERINPRRDTALFRAQACPAVCCRFRFINSHWRRAGRRDRRHFRRIYAFAFLVNGRFFTGCRLNCRLRCRRRCREVPFFDLRIHIRRIRLRLSIGFCFSGFRGRLRLRCRLFPRCLRFGFRRFPGGFFFCRRNLFRRWQRWRRRNARQLFRRGFVERHHILRRR